MIILFKFFFSLFFKRINEGKIDNEEEEEMINNYLI